MLERKTLGATTQQREVKEQGGETVDAAHDIAVCEEAHRKRRHPGRYGVRRIDLALEQPGNHDGAEEVARHRVLELGMHGLRMLHQLGQVARRKQQKDRHGERPDGLADPGRRPQAAVRNAPGQGQPRRAHDRGEQAGTTPAEFVENARIDAARRLAEESDMPAKRLASAVGHANVDGFRRAFGRRLGVSLVDYRRRFAR